MKNAFPVFFLLILFIEGNSQNNPFDSIKAFYTRDPVVLDGKFDEPDWHSAQHISRFVQRELDFGKPCTERTEVAVLYNDLSIYIGVWCYQQNPGSIRAKYMLRDFPYDEDDNFQVALCPYSDRR